MWNLKRTRKCIMIVLLMFCNNTSTRLIFIFKPSDFYQVNIKFNQFFLKNLNHTKKFLNNFIIMVDSLSMRYLPAYNCNGIFCTGIKYLWHQSTKLRCINRGESCRWGYDRHGMCLALQSNILFKNTSLSTYLFRYTWVNQHASNFKGI